MGTEIGHVVAVFGAATRDMEAALAKMKGQLGGLEAPAEKSNVSFKKLGGAVHLISGELAGMSPAVSTASSALSTLLYVGINPVTLGIVAASLAVAAAVAWWQRHKDALEENLQIEQQAQAAFGKRMQAAAQLSLGIRNETELLQSQDPAMTQIIQRHKELEYQLQKTGGTAQQFADLELRTSTALSKLADDKLRASQDYTRSLAFQGAALGATGEQTAALATEQKILSLSTAEAVAKYGPFINTMIESEKALLALRLAQDRVKTGMDLISGVGQAAGVPFEIDTKKQGSDMADKFVSVFEAMSGDTKNRAALAAIFKKFVEDAVAAGVPDISELLASKGLSSSAMMDLRDQLSKTQIGTKTETTQETTLGGVNVFGGPMGSTTEEVERLVPLFGTELVAAIDASSQAGQQWGETFQAEVAKFAQAGFQAQTSMETLKREINDVVTAVSRDMAARINIDGALADVDQLLTMIPDVVTIRARIVPDLGGLESLIRGTTGLEPGFQVFP
jgi:hypothetical protein